MRESQSGCVIRYGGPDFISWTSYAIRLPLQPTLICLEKILMGLRSGLHALRKRAKIVVQLGTEDQTLLNGLPTLLCCYDDRAYSSSEKMQRRDVAK